MTQFRYRLTLRPLSQHNLPRLGFVDGSFREGAGRQFDDPFGSFATSRRLTDFEVSQLSLIFEGEERV
jgi:hypothetical protein